jgi:type I restriction enzyme M protein
VSYDKIKEKNYSFSAGQYFQVKIEYKELTHEEFANKMDSYRDELNTLIEESYKVDKELKNQMDLLRYN